MISVNTLLGFRLVVEKYFGLVITDLGFGITRISVDRWGSRATERVGLEG